MRVCQKCGAEVEKDDSYCPDCGAKLESVTKKVTVGTVFKILGIIFLFFIIIHFLKNNSPVGIFLLILFLIWGILNLVLKKLFNTEISTGVKIIITAVIIVIFLVAAQTSKLEVAQAPQFRYEEGDLYSFVDRINQIMEARDFESLKIMLKEDMISSDVFEEILELFESGDYSISLKPYEPVFYDSQAELKVAAIIKKVGYKEIESGVICFFEKTERGWRLYAIKPRLLDIKLSRSFEEEAVQKIEVIQKPVIAISKSVGASHRTNQ